MMDEQKEIEDQENEDDSKLDAIAATVLIIATAAIAVFWVSNQ